MDLNTSFGRANLDYTKDIQQFIHIPSTSLKLGTATLSSHNTVAPIGALSSLIDNAYLRLLLVLSLPFAVNYLLLWLIFQTSKWDKTTEKMPPKIPYLVPFLGSTILYLWNPMKFIKSST